jgi:hypothetical protein
MKVTHFDVQASSCNYGRKIIVKSFVNTHPQWQDAILDSRVGICKKNCDKIAIKININ